MRELSYIEMEAEVRRFLQNKNGLRLFGVYCAFYDRSHNVPAHLQRINSATVHRGKVFVGYDGQELGRTYELADAYQMIQYRNVCDEDRHVFHKMKTEAGL